MIVKLIILGIILLLIVVITILIISCKSKLNITNIKIKEAEKNINSLLNKKVKNIAKIKPLILEEIEEQNFLDDIENYNIEEQKYFESNSDLADYYSELITVIDENEKLLNNEKINKIIEKLENNEVELKATIKYYNDNVNKFNEKINKFPNNIYRMILGYKKKELFKDETREEFEILKGE